MEKFKWKAGSQFKVKAQVAVEAIENLQRTLGRETITAKELLDDARDVNAPLHCCFEWDDTIAAEKYREWQARHLIHSIEVVITKSDHPVTVRQYLNIKPVGAREEGAFAPIQVILKNPTLREQALSNALSELHSFQKRYAAYEELTGVFDAIDSFGDTLK